MSGEAPCCVLGAIPVEERPKYTALRDELLRALPRSGIEERENGFRLRFGQAPLAKIGAWIDYERLCCPFLGFEISIQPGSELVDVELSGPPGTKELLQAALF